MERITQLRSCTFFLATIIDSNPDTIEKTLKVLSDNRSIIENDINTLVYYMNGGLDYNDSWLLTNDQRKKMFSIIKKHFESMNPKKANML